MNEKERFQERRSVQRDFEDCQSADGLPSVRRRLRPVR